MVRKVRSRTSYVFLQAILILSFVNSGSALYSQGQPGEYFYRISFTDKGTNTRTDYSLNQLFSQRAVARRNRAGIFEPDFRDIPVFKPYLDELTAEGVVIHCTSRWMNTAVVRSSRSDGLTLLSGLPFVREIREVKKPGTKSAGNDKLDFTADANGIPAYDEPLSMLNGLKIHNSGFTGKGVLICVLDAGFLNADNISSLDHLRLRDGIKGTRDFVGKSGNVYDYHNHGTAVLSILSGLIPDAIAGTAPGSDYWLLRTEDDATEFPVEEDFWIAGAEFADSVGADIVTSSLGYFLFDDPLMNYRYSDMDGNTAFITRAADIAASKGLLVVCSAGNERDNEWRYIIAPSDGDSVLAVGAVDGGRTISLFSSAGPSYDRQIKPDVVAQGVSVPIQVSGTTVARGNGTSFSCPVISGMTACIMQAVPQAPAAEIIRVLHEASDRYTIPDSLYGFGIPDFEKVIRLLQERTVVKPANGSVAWPNPFTGSINIIFTEPPGDFTLEIFNTSGMLVYREVHRDYISRSLVTAGPGKLGKGLYFLRITTNAGRFIHKIMKL